MYKCNCAMRVILNNQHIVAHQSIISHVFIAMSGSDCAEEDRKVLAQFKDENGVLVKMPFDIPVNITPDLLQSLCNTVVSEVIARVVSAGSASVLYMILVHIP